MATARGRNNLLKVRSRRKRIWQAKEGSVLKQLEMSFPPPQKQLPVDWRDDWYLPNRTELRDRIETREFRRHFERGNMATLKELQKKYKLQGGRYEPNPDCKFCKGSGERIVPRIGKLHFCICLFVAPDFSNEAGELIGKFAKQALENTK